MAMGSNTKYKVSVYCYNCSGLTEIIQTIGEFLPDTFECSVCGCQSPTHSKTNPKVIKESEIQNEL